MRILIVILLLVGASFVVVATYALVRPAGPATTAPSTSCASPPPMKDGEVDRDAIEDWCRDPPGLLAGITRRFGPRTYFLSQPVAAPHGGVDATEDAPPAPPGKRDEPAGEMRLAPFEWRAGGPMLIRHGDQALCLCRPGGELDAGVMEACGEGWVAHRRAAGGALLCGEDDGQGAIVLDPDGGQVRFHALGDPATVAQPEH
ncbi:hypothetical protein [Sphingomonas sp. DT-204]|uniref:hypothetical protein n=1 Tax=Sphingomonas sp. DT-204 TaxID=3396166 RepID=UPI003F1B4D67